jgi:hypothetical protein
MLTLVWLYGLAMTIYGGVVDGLGTALEIFTLLLVTTFGLMAAAVIGLIRQRGSQ